MSCENKVSYYVPRGYDYREVFVKCGNTDPYGNRAICEECDSDPVKMKRIEMHEANVAADNAWLKSAGWGEM
jgi:hypothetical protein|tara:strand:- start:587 stop:802 length:216 start_codon:yes stop_codon:yes gene_type:complete